MGTFLLRGLRFLRGRVFGKGSPQHWAEVEHFDQAWRARISEIATLIPPGASVLDLGCGKMWLKDYFSGEQYYPVDYTQRSTDTIVCDFNKREFPSIRADVAVVSGCLEYLKEYEWFISEIATHVERCVISYNSVEQYPDRTKRRAMAWVNDLTHAELIRLFRMRGMVLVEQKVAADLHHIFVFDRTAVRNTSRT